MTLRLEARGLVPNITQFTYKGNPLNIGLAAGEIIAIIGPDYTGKSDWLRTFAGLHYPLQGKLSYNGHDFHELDDEKWTWVRQKYAYVSCDTELLSAANGLANVMLPARYHHIGESDDIEIKATNLAIELGASQSLGRLPYFIRRDQRFKLAIARALMLDPVVMFLDNPFVLLDNMTTARFKAAILSRVRNQNLSLVVVTYDLDFTIKSADKILFVTAEQVYLFNSAEEARESEEPAIAEFLGKRPDSWKKDG